jgi:hypothetical protein
MRHAALLLALITAIPASTQAADIIFDSGGFEAYSHGDVNGQHGWRNDDFDPIQPNTTAAIATAPGSHGNALSFENAANTESSATVDFTNLVGAYNYAAVSFDVFRDGDGTNNNLWWSATGSLSTGFYGLAAGGAAPSVLPVGYFGGAPSAAFTPSGWMSVLLEYDLVHGEATALVNGQIVAQDVAVGVSPTFSGWNFTDQNLGTGPGQRVFVDNLVVSAANSAPVPEPGSLWLLAAGAPLAILVSRRRRRLARPT